MPDPRPIEAVPAHPSNYQAGRNGQVPIAIVYHVMQGTWAGTGAWFARARANPSSAHFGVSSHGRIAQYVALTNTAYSNGIIRAPQTGLIPWLTDAIRQGINPNDLTIAIEMEGMQTGTWVVQAGGVETFAPKSITTWWQPTEEQYQAVQWLTRQIRAGWGGIPRPPFYDLEAAGIARWQQHGWTIPADRAHLCRHSDFDQIGKWWCPGQGFPLARLLREEDTAPAL